MNIKTPIASIGSQWQQQYGAVWAEMVVQLMQHHAEYVEEIQLPADALTDIPSLYIRPLGILKVTAFLKGQLKFDFLSDLTATDEQPHVPRFCVVYHLMSTDSFARVRIKVRVDAEIESITSVFKSADWAEREVYDMFGVHFLGHSDLRRILMHDAWQGYPLRKDYPLRGVQVMTTAHAPNEALLGLKKDGL